MADETSWRSAYGRAAQRVHDLLELSRRSGSQVHQAVVAAHEAVDLTLILREELLDRIRELERRVEELERELSESRTPRAGPGDGSEPG